MPSSAKCLVVACFGLWLTLALTVVVYGQLSTFAERLPSFAQFKSIYGKIYASPQEDLRREKIFNKTIRKIDRHNRLMNEGKATYALYPCEYSDMDTQEVATFLKGISLPDDLDDPDDYANKLNTSVKQASSSEVLPDSFDYRTTGCLSLPKNQKFCGSCWAFATTSAIETMKCLRTGRLETMSEQNLIDCANRKNGYKLDGCNGGFMGEAFKYVVNNNGIDDDECYPYGSNDRGECRYQSKCKVGSVAKWSRVAPTEEALKEAIVKKGPVTAAIHTNDDFFSYNSGIYDDPKCTNDRDKINHGVLVVGYGSEDGKDFWIIKNSWGFTWGQKGYMKIARGRNACCIACYTYYIEL